MTISNNLDYVLVISKRSLIRYLLNNYTDNFMAKQKKSCDCLFTTSKKVPTKIISSIFIIPQQGKSLKVGIFLNGLKIGIQSFLKNINGRKSKISLLPQIRCSELKKIAKTSPIFIYLRRKYVCSSDFLAEIKHYCSERIRFLISLPLFDSRLIVYKVLLKWMKH